MPKVIEKDTVKTDFNIYQQYLEKRYMKKYVHNFNRLFKSKIKEGKTSMLTSEPAPSVNGKGLNKQAKKNGINRGKQLVAEKYPIKTVPSGLWFDCEIFEL